MPKGPQVGDPAPDFTLPSTSGEISLSARLATGPVCTRQLCNYRDNLDVFAELDIQVVAINPQSESSHGQFASKHDLPFPLVSDSGGTVCKAYGAVNFLGMAKRALVLVGRDGQVRWRRSDLPIFHQSADDIRDAVAELAS
jgi:peroxiredoxin